MKYVDLDTASVQEQVWTTLGFLKCLCLLEPFCLFPRTKHISLSQVETLSCSQGTAWLRKLAKYKQNSEDFSSIQTQVTMLICPIKMKEKRRKALDVNSAGSSVALSFTFWLHLTFTVIFWQYPSFTICLSLSFSYCWFNKANLSKLLLTSHF